MFTKEVLIYSAVTFGAVIVGKAIYHKMISKYINPAIKEDTAGEGEAKDPKGGAEATA